MVLYYEGEWICSDLLVALSFNLIFVVISLNPFRLPWHRLSEQFMVLSSKTARVHAH